MPPLPKSPAREANFDRKDFRFDSKHLYENTSSTSKIRISTFMKKLFLQPLTQKTLISSSNTR